MYFIHGLHYHIAVENRCIFVLSSSEYAVEKQSLSQNDGIDKTYSSVLLLPVTGSL